MKKNLRKMLFGTLVLLLASILSHQAQVSAEEEMQTGYCTNFTLESIPVGNFFPPHDFPINLGNSQFELGSGVTGLYNTDQYGKGSYCCVTDTECHTLGVDIQDVEQFKQICNGHDLWYGHTGVDIGVGKKEVKAIQPMFIVASLKSKGEKDWGETIVGAVRASPYSEEIITFHHHHLDGTKNPYSTTRKFNACQTVDQDAILGIAGKTGWAKGIHLHFGMRRWKNLAALKAAIASKKLNGNGYVYSEKAKLQGYLDPYRFLRDSFTEIEKPDLSDWEKEWLSYARTIRSLGIEFGKWDGSFGAADSMSRGEAARWISIATHQPIPTQQTSKVVFPSDVAKNSEFFNYVQNLAYYPQSISVINRNNGTSYLPDKGTQRAQALKMTTLAFYDSEFLDYTKYYYGYNTIADILLQDGGQVFNDVNFTYVDLLNQFTENDWFNCYVYFGLHKGTVSATPSKLFSPTQEINRAAFSKWLIQGHNAKFGAPQNPCLNIVCPENQYCVNGGCIAIPQCVPVEEKTCTIAGGSGGNCGGEGVCTQGEVQKQACPNGQFSYKNCKEDCSWSDWTACGTPQQCNPGETESMLCNGGSGIQSRTCDANGNWSTWGSCIPQQSCVCQNGICCDGCNYKTSSQACNSSEIYQCQGTSPGQDIEKAVVTQYCSGFDANCTGSTTQGSWQFSQDCTTNEICKENGSIAYCATCQEAYTTSTAGTCSDNPQGSGNPTICLEVSHISGTLWEYRLHKTTGTFGNVYNYHLEDSNYTKIFPTYQGTAQNAYSAWQTIDLGYIQGLGNAKGAGLIAKVSSPSGCTDALCQYHTGFGTVYKIMQCP